MLRVLGIKWNLEFDNASRKFQRSYALVGENGAGKTQLLSNLVNDICKGRSSNLQNVPLLAKVLVVCSSYFDHYNEKEFFPKVLMHRSGGQKIQKDVCFLIHDHKTKKNLRNAINNILSYKVLSDGKEKKQLFEHYLELIHKHFRKEEVDELFVPVRNRYLSSKNRKRAKYGIPALNIKKLDYLVDTLSTGQFQIFSLITYVCTHIELNSLVVLDEPEVHLHPLYITTFFEALADLLEKFESYAIIATHSPLIVRECVSSNVYKVIRSVNNEMSIGRVPFPTFGEDISTLYSGIYSCDETNSYFYRVVKENVMEGKDYSTIIRELSEHGNKLSMNSRSLIHNCCETKLDSNEEH